MDLVQEFIANPDPNMEAFGVRTRLARQAERFSGFKIYQVPSIGVELGIKNADWSSGGAHSDAFLVIEDIQKLVPQASSKSFGVHLKFDGGSSSSDGFFEMDFDYFFAHNKSSIKDEGSMRVKREKKGSMWKTEIEIFTDHFRNISSMNFELESDRATTLKGKYQYATMGHNITWDIVRQLGKSIKAIIVRDGVTSTIEGTFFLSGPARTWRSGQDVEIIIKADIRG